MDSAVDFIIDNTPFFGLLLFVGLQFIALLLAPPGAWRIAAYIPLILVAPIAGWCVLALIAQSNLWPMPLILYAPLAILYLAAFIIVVSVRRALTAARG